MLKGRACGRTWTLETGGCLTVASKQREELPYPAEHTQRIRQCRGAREVMNPGGICGVREPAPAKKTMTEHERSGDSSRVVGIMAKTGHAASRKGSQSSPAGSSLHGPPSCRSKRRIHLAGVLIAGACVRRLLLRSRACNVCSRGAYGSEGGAVKAQSGSCAGVRNWKLCRVSQQCDTVCRAGSEVASSALTGAQRKTANSGSALAALASCGVLGSIHTWIRGVLSSDNSRKHAPIAEITVEPVATGNIWLAEVQPIRRSALPGRSRTA